MRGGAKTRTALRTAPAPSTTAPSPVLVQLEPFLPGKGESIAIIGVSQNGKTTEAWKWATALSSTRRIAWDPCHQWAKDGRPRDDTKLGPLERTVTIDELEERPDMLLERNLSLAVRPVDIWADRSVIAEEFIRFGYLVVRTMPGGRLVVFVDECNLLTENRRALNLLDDMAERWGKEGIVPIFITQRWSHLTPNVRAELAYVVSFHQNKSSDLRMLTDDAGRDFSQAVGELKPYEYRARYLRKKLPDELTA